MLAPDTRQQGLRLSLHTMDLITFTAGFCDNHSSLLLDIQLIGTHNKILFHEIKTFNRLALPRMALLFHFAPSHDLI